MWIFNCITRACHNCQIPPTWACQNRWLSIQALFKSYRSFSSTFQDLWEHCLKCSALPLSEICLPTEFPIGTTRPIPPNRRSCLGCIRWKDMSNPKRLRWNIVWKPTKAVRRLRTNLNILNNAQSELLGQFRLTGDRTKYSMYSILYIDGDVTMC